MAKEFAAVTLMSADIDGIANGLQNLHELWAAILEMGLGVYLLTRQIGAACFLIVIPTVCKCSNLIGPTGRLC